MIKYFTSKKITENYNSVLLHVDSFERNGKLRKVPRFAQVQLIIKLANSLQLTAFAI
jgi:hypothetical protein